jgi:cytochrome oxidase Cu insertion factor (SCO1/SenC/PrrC family)
VAALLKTPPFLAALTTMMKTFLPLLPLFALTVTAALADVEAQRSELSLRRTAEYDYDVPEPGTYTLPVVKPAADGTVLGSDGKPVRLHELAHGRITILSFIYTRCTDPRACLRASGVLKQLQQLTLAEPAVATNLLLLTLSFDPAHDTPEVMSRYGSVFNRKQGGADWLFLTTENRNQLVPLLDRYGQQVDRARPGSGTGPYNHLLRVYLIDGQKRIRNIYGYGLLDPRLVITDVRTLLMEAAQPKAARLTQEPSANQAKSALQSSTSRQPFASQTSANPEWDGSPIVGTDRELQD